jgi:hypothetical protein
MMMMIYFLKVKQYYTVRKMEKDKLIYYVLLSTGTAVPLHAMEALGGEEL